LNKINVKTPISDFEFKSSSRGRDGGLLKYLLIISIIVISIPILFAISAPKVPPLELSGVYIIDFQFEEEDDTFGKETSVLISATLRNFDDTPHDLYVIFTIRETSSENITSGKCHNCTIQSDSNTTIAKQINAIEKAQYEIKVELYQWINNTHIRYIDERTDVWEPGWF